MGERKSLVSNVVWTMSRSLASNGVCILESLRETWLAKLYDVEGSFNTTTSTSFEEDTFLKASICKVIFGLIHYSRILSCHSLHLLIKSVICQFVILINVLRALSTNVKRFNVTSLSNLDELQKYSKYENKEYDE